MKLFYIFLLPLLLLGVTGNSFAQVDIDPEPVLPEPCIDSLEFEFIPVVTGPDDCDILFILDVYQPDSINPVYVLNLDWDFGDGTVVSHPAGGQYAGAHTYAEAGTYAVCVTAWTTNGEDCCKTTYCAEVVVENACSICDELDEFDFDIARAGARGLTISLAGYPGWPGDVFGYVLDYGNGRVEPIAFPKYMFYPENGSYNISVTIFYVDQVTGECCSYTVTKSVVINARGGALTTAVLGEESDVVSIQSDHITVFPNPSNGEFTLQATNDLSIESVTVYDLTGAVLYQLNDVQNLKEVQMDLQHLSSGMYYVMINEANEANRAFKQLVIE